MFTRSAEKAFCISLCYDNMNFNQGETSPPLLLCTHNQLNLLLPTTEPHSQWLLEQSGSRDLIPAPSRDEAGCQHAQALCQEFSCALQPKGAARSVPALGLDSQVFKGF